MDFLPGAKPNSGGIKVPFRADAKVVTPEEWYTFVKVTRISKAADFPGDDLAACLQSYLFFGQIAALTGSSVDIEHLRHDPGIPNAEATVETAAVRQLVIDAGNELRKRDRSSLGLTQPAHILNRTMDMIQTIETEIAIDKDQTLASVCASILILASYFISIVQIADEEELARKRSITERARHFFGKYDILVPTDVTSPALSVLAWPAHRIKPYPSGILLQQTMLSAGWCRHQVRKIMRNFPFHIVNHFALLPRRCDPGISHKNCSEANCSAWTVGSELDFPKHASPGCNCEILTVSSTKVAAIIGRGGIPLISIGRDHRGKVALKVTRRRSYDTPRSRLCD